MLLPLASAELQARLAAAGCDRPLPRRLQLPALAPAAELGLLRGALGGALADAKAQLQQLQLLSHGQQQEEQVQVHEQQHPGAGQVAGGQQLEQGVGEGGGAGAELLVAGGSEGGLGVVELAAGAGAGGGGAAAGAAGPAAFDTGSFLMSRLEARLNVALPAVAEAVARMVGWVGRVQAEALWLPYLMNCVRPAVPHVVQRVGRSVGQELCKGTNEFLLCANAPEPDTLCDSVAPSPGVPTTPTCPPTPAERSAAPCPTWRTQCTADCAPTSVRHWSVRQWPGRARNGAGPQGMGTGTGRGVG